MPVTVVEYDEDSNVVCPVCGRPMGATVKRVWTYVPCWSAEGEFSFSWGGELVEAEVTGLTCSGCTYSVEAPIELVKQEREQQGVLV
jgi:hypothetical protein